MTTKIDIVLITTPVFDFKLPNPSIYQLKGTLNLHGIQSRCFDLTQESVRHFGDNYDLINKCLLEHYYKITENDNLIKDFYSSFVDTKIKPLNPQWIGINVHSVYNYKSTSFLTNIIKEKLPEVKIIIGGDGYRDKTVDANPFNDNIKSDFWIRGDGELALVELLKTNIQPEKKEQKINLNSLPFPDYSDYYKDFGNLDSIAITGSKGCCNKCNYCSISYYHNIYRERTAINIYKEMRQHCQLYNTKHFQFSDSIINGNLKRFREFLHLMIKLKEEFQINYSGYFGVNENMVEDDFKLMQKSNILNPWLGVESASEKVRQEMNKKFSNKSLYFTIDNLLKNNISPALLFLIGYPTETKEDFQENIDFLNHYKNNSDKIILSFGETYHVRKETPAEKLDIYTQEIPNNILFWKSKIVPDLDFPERVRRRKILSKISKELGYSFSKVESKNIKYLDKKLDIYLKYKNGGN